MLEKIQPEEQFTFEECVQFAHKTLYRLHYELHNNQNIIEWQVIVPLSPEEKKHNIRESIRGQCLLGIVQFVSIFAWLALTFYFEKRDIAWIFALNFLPLWFIQMELWNNYQILQQQTSKTRLTVKLNFVTQTIVVSENKEYNHARYVAFHKNFLFEPFWLPENDAPRYQQLREQVQQMIAQKAGVRFNRRIMYRIKREPR